MKTQDILNEREKTHGDFGEVAAAWCELTTAFDEHYRDSCVVLNDRQASAIKMILLKLARIICGDPNFADHWDDIEGYAMLGKGRDDSDPLIKKEWFKTESCGHSNKKRSFYSDTAKANGLRRVDEATPTT